MTVFYPAFSGLLVGSAVLFWMQPDTPTWQWMVVFAVVMVVVMFIHIYSPLPNTNHPLGANQAGYWGFSDPGEDDGS